MDSLEPEQPKVDPSVIEELKRILAKHETSITPDEAAFLRARKHYVGKNSRQRLAFIFDAKPEEDKPKDPKKEKKAEVKEEEKKTATPPVEDENKKDDTPQVDTVDDDDLDEIDEDDEVVE